MKILIESNIDCSFMQKIIKLPHTKNELIHANIDKRIVNILDNYQVFISEIRFKFIKFNHIVSFIENCFLNDHIYYVHTFSDDLEDITENREYICFGEYHRKSRGRTFFLRIDQEWDSFNFSFFQNIPESINFVKLLSGSTINLLLPEIIFRQECLNDVDFAFGTKEFEFVGLHNYYLIASRYFGKKYFINHDGDIYFVNSDEQRMLKANINFEQWLEKELNNIFEHQSKETE